MGREAMRGLGRALRGEGGGEHWLERLMGDEQRAPVPRDAGRDEPARGLQRLRHGRGRAGSSCPDVERIRARFHERRAKRTPFERAMLRLTGMDLKLEQYKKGETFVRAIADARGPAALTRLWDGPETLPRDGEIEAPERWIARVLDGRAAP